MPIASRSFDVIIVGAGGAGLRAALQLAQAHKKVAVVSKVFPTRSHTVSAQGGITVALGNAHEDNWQWHMFDTIKGSDYLGDQDSIEYMCQVGPEVVYELEHMGLPFSRMDDGRIYQRPFGGQSKNFGKGGQATRTSAAADRTGHALLHTLYQKNIQADTTFFSEWYGLDLVKGLDGSVQGVVAMCMETGELLFLHAAAVILATGGAGQIFQSTTNALINTGDGLGMALRAGAPLQDMEMWQFHPTGLAGAGVLISEGTRGEGGYLINANGERFMEHYAPHAKDLASRDVVARSIGLELRAGRGCGKNKDYVFLKLDHLGADLTKSRLPGIRELAMTFANIDPITDPIPVVPTSHYMMGGIPTNKHGQVLNLPGLYAIGECACVSVHGANRLGGNSLLDLVVFGRAAGIHLVEQLNSGLAATLVIDDSVAAASQRFTKWNTNKDGESVSKIRKDLQKIMQEDFGVFRTAKYMQAGINKLQDLRACLAAASLQDHSNVFNTARIEALELDNMLAVAITTALAANTRTESRGAHFREDFPKRDDTNWIKHSLVFANDKVDYRPVNMQPLTVPAFLPQERIY